MANRLYKIRELCEITSSKRIYAADYKPEGVPFFRGKEISEKHRGELEVSTELYIDRDMFERIRAKFGAPVDGDLLLTSVGTLGTPYLVKDGEEFYFKDGNLTWFRHFNQLDSRFLYYWLQSPQGKAELKKCIIGSSQSAYTIVLLKEMEISSPPLQKQRIIACILSAYDDLIEDSTRRIKLLEKTARLIYREWFVNYRFPGHEKIAFVNSPYGRLPNGWNLKNLSSLINFHIGGGWGKDEPDKMNSEAAWVIRGTDIPNARICRVPEVPYRYHSKTSIGSRLLQEGDIVFEVSGGSKGQPVGRSLLITKEIISAFNYDAIICASFCKKIRPDTAKYGSEILYLSFFEGYYSGEIEQYQVQSTGLSNFKWTEYINNTNRVVPPKELLVYFRKVVSPLFSQIGTLGLQISNLNRTRDYLLPKLISGEIEIL